VAAAAGGGRRAGPAPGGRGRGVTWPQVAVAPPASSPDLVELVEPARVAGVLSDADVHIAAAVCRLCGEHDPDVVLAVALAARAPRLGHVALDLWTVAATITSDLHTDGGAEAVASLRWPEPGAWLEAVRASPVTTPAGDVPAPLVVHGGLVYLERYRDHEVRVVDDLRRRATATFDPIDIGPSAALLLAGEGATVQRDAVRQALAGGLAVLVGGPGTGKTTTVAAMLASLLEGDDQLRIALAAPTGKAAARLGEAIVHAAAQLPEPLASRLRAAPSTTIHRLLGPRHDTVTTFRHHRAHPLALDVVIVDETSMVSLPLMARLLDAVRPDARVVLVGDPGQLASVEAGSVLSDIVGPAATAAATDAGGSGPPRTGPLAGCISVLRHSRRFPPGSPLDRLAGAVRDGDADRALEVLREHRGDGDGSVTWTGVGGDSAAGAAAVRAVVEPAARQAAALAEVGSAPEALAASARVRLLCAHRHGGFGVSTWNERVETWLHASGVAARGWYPGRPVMVTANDPVLRRSNGDIGIVVRRDHRLVVCFDDPGAGDVAEVAPSRLGSFETVHAMTIHKSQGSEFDHVVVVLPPGGSRLATRELLYTAITRARRQVTLVGDEESVRAAVGRAVARASGIRQALWGDEGS